MKDELRRYVNKFPTVAIENLNEPGSPAFFSDFTVPKVGSRSVCVERERFLPNSRWMYFFEDEVLALYENGDVCTKDSWEYILSELGFIVVEDDTLGLFFGCDGEVSDDVWDTLLDIIEDGMRGDAEDYPDGILICGKCPTRYYIEELEDAIGRDEINRMINEKNTILCPVCATAAGYGHKE